MTKRLGLTARVIRAISNSPAAGPKEHARADATAYRPPRAFPIQVETLSAGTPFTSPTGRGRPAGPGEGLQQLPPAEPPLPTGEREIGRELDLACFYLNRKCSKAV